MVEMGDAWYFYWEKMPAGIPNPWDL